MVLGHFCTIQITSATKNIHLVLLNCTEMAKNVLNCSASDVAVDFSVVDELAM